MGVLGVFTAAFLYMYAAITGRDKFKDTARKILWDVTFTLVIVLVATPPLSQISSEVVRAIDPEGSNVYCGPRSIPDFCAVDVARGYYQVLAMESMGSIREMFRYYGIVKIFESVPVKAYEGQKATSIKPFEQNVSLMMLMFEKLLDLIKLVVVVSVMQLFIFDFFTNPAVFVALLVFGSLFRMFPPTRKTGGLLMAISFVMFFFFPVLAAIPDAVYFTYPINPNSNMRLNLFYSPGFMEFGIGLPPNVQPIAPSTSPAGYSPNNAGVAANNIFNSIASTSFSNLYGRTVQPPPPNSGVTITMFRTMTAVLAPVLPMLAYEATYSVVDAAVSIFGGPFIPDSVVDTASSVVAGGAGLVASGAVFFFTISSIELTYIVMVSAAEVVATFLIFSGFFSYAILIATIGAIKSLSQFFGGDTEIAGLTKFI